MDVTRVEKKSKLTYRYKKAQKKVMKQRYQTYLADPRNLNCKWTGTPPTQSCVSAYPALHQFLFVLAILPPLFRTRFLF